jgi:hypothetical protein
LATADVRKARRKSVVTRTRRRALARARASRARSAHRANATAHYIALLVSVSEYADNLFERAAWFLRANAQCIRVF